MRPLEYIAYSCIISIAACGCRTYHNNIISVIYSKNLDIICITETWLNNSVLSKEILPTLYTIYRNDRANRGGGVLIAIKNSIPSQLFITSNSIEMIAVYINTRPKLLLVCLYIRHPTAQLITWQQETLCTISNLPSDTNTIILGDFNAPDINWLTLTAGSLFSRDLCNTLHLQIKLYTYN